MKTHIKTSKKNYLLNLGISSIIGLTFGFELPLIIVTPESSNLPFLIMLTLIIFHHSFRAGEYILTGKTISISPRLIGFEQRGKEARRSFLYYIITVMLMCLFIIYFSFFM